MSKKKREQKSQLSSFLFSVSFFSVAKDKNIEWF
jgi:hypothetical protein